MADAPEDRRSPRQLILIGHSSGAHLAALLALDRRYLTSGSCSPGAITAVVGMSGPYDFLPLTQAKYLSIFPEATRAASQPIAFVDGEAAPMLLLTGDADTTVDPGNSTRLAERIGKRRRGLAESLSGSWPRRHDPVAYLSEPVREAPGA